MFGSYPNFHLLCTEQYDKTTNIALFLAIKYRGLQTYKKYGKNQKETNTTRATQGDVGRRFSRNLTEKDGIQTLYR